MIGAVSVGSCAEVCRLLEQLALNGQATVELISRQMATLRELSVVLLDEQPNKQLELPLNK